MPRVSLLTQPIMVYAALITSLAAGLLGGAAVEVQAGSPLQAGNAATLRVAMPAPDTLDPIRVSRFDRSARDLVENLSVGLTRFDPATQAIEPAAAESWAVSDDGLTWTFTLRDDLQWVRYDSATDQVVAVRPVVAGDFVYSVQRACDPLRPSPLTANLMVIRGCQTVAQAFPEVVNDLFIAREIGIRATSPTTLEVELLFPTSYFLTLTSTMDYRPIPREQASLSAEWWANSGAMTNGPFVLQALSASGATLIRNPEWPLSFGGNVSGVNVTFAAAPRPTAAYDWLPLEGDQLTAARSATPDLIHTTPAGPVVALGFSHDRAVIDTEPGRRALSLGLDRAALVQSFLLGSAQPLAQFTPSGNVAQPVFESMAFDPARAQQALTEAGFEGCNAIPETLLLLVPDDDPTWMQLGQAIVDQWAANLGCNPALFEVRALPRTLMIELAHNTYDVERVTRSHMWLATWSADYPDGVAWINDALHCRYGYIQPGRACGPADTLLDRAAQSTDDAARADLLAQAEGAFFGPQGSFPVAPLFVIDQAWLTQPWLTQVNAVGAARYDLWAIDTEAQAG